MTNFSSAGTQRTAPVRSLWRCEVRFVQFGESANLIWLLLSISMTQDICGFHIELQCATQFFGLNLDDPLGVPLSKSKMWPPAGIQTDKPNGADSAWSASSSVYPSIEPTITIV